MKYIEKQVHVPEPDDPRFFQMVHLLEALGWDGYHTNYTGDEIDAEQYGDDVHDYTILVPENQLDIFELLDECDVFDY